MHDANASGEAAAPEAFDLANDTLAQGLAWITRHHGRERSPESLLHGVPLAGRLTPDIALRALREAGYDAGIVQRRLAELNPLLMPALLLCKDGGAVVVTARDAAQPTQYRIVVPGRLEHSRQVEAAELEPLLNGLALVATPQLAPPDTEGNDANARDPARHWFWGTMRRFVPYYRSALLAALLSNVLMLVTGLVTSVVFDKVIPHQAFVTLWALATASALALSFDLIAKQLRAYLIDLAGRKADLLVGSALYRQTLAVRMEERPESAGAYAHTLGMIEVVREFYASATLSALSDLPFIVIFVGMTFFIGGPLGWVPVLAIPVLLGLSAAIQGALRRASSANLKQLADLSGVLVETVEGMEDLKAAGAQGRFLRHYEETTAAAAETALRTRHITAWTTNLSMVAQQAVTIIMLVWGVYLIDDKVITGGALIGAVMFCGRALAPLSSIVSLATRYQGARGAMMAMDRVMAQPTEREAGKRYVPQRNLSGRLALREVSFAYPTPEDKEPGPRVIKGVSLALRAGERVAMLGRIGSGKSTVLRLLAGLYLPSEGLVEADGVDLRQIDPADFRAQVGFVAQDPRLFNGTLRDNILLDRPTADPARLGEVARLTGLDRLVAGHPMGWELPVGECGTLLSGGQRQLVALARCLITRPRILLMDEPTSSMDAQSEVAFLRQLKEAMGDCTLVMVTHRPAVLELVQRVVVVDNGRVVLDGPKDQVLEALSGGRPAAQTNLHMHPSAQPVQREAAL